MMSELGWLTTVVPCRSRDFDELLSNSEALISTAMASQGRADTRTVYSNTGAANMQRNWLRKNRTALCALPAIRGFRGRGVIG